MKTFLYSVFCVITLSLLSACGSEDKAIIPIEKIELDKSVLLLQVGQESQLHVVFFPEQATNKDVVWKSDDASVAQVSTSGVVRGLKEGKTFISVQGDGGLHAVCEVRVLPASETGRAIRTVLVYMAADNGLNRFAMQDLLEMKAGLSQMDGEGIHLLVYRDIKGSPLSPRLVELRRDDSGTVEEIVLKTYPSRNSVGLSETLEVFSDAFGHPAYQADSYGLVYWSHGDGWIPASTPSTRWIGNENESAGPWMNLSDFVKILQSAPHFDYILFDACFMQSVEVAYELRRFADYIICSPTETPGPGAPYTQILPYMFMKGEEVALADAYFKVYEQTYNGTTGTNEDWTGGVSIAVVKTAELENLANITRKGVGEAGVWSPAALRAMNIFDYDKRSGIWHVGYYDMQQLMNRLFSSDTYQHWKAAYDATLIYWNTTPMNYSASLKEGLFTMEGAQGVSHYIPVNTVGPAVQAYRQTSWYQDAGLSQLTW